MINRGLTYFIAVTIMFALATLALAGERPPSALVPDSTLFYGEINLDELARGVSYRDFPVVITAFRDNLSAWPVLMHLQSDNPSPVLDPKAVDSYMSALKPTLKSLLRAGGPRIAFAIWPSGNTSENSSNLAIIIEARDINALHNAVMNALDKERKKYAISEPIPGIRRFLTAADDAIIEGDDWLALVPKNAALAMETAATENGKGSLWASPSYRQALEGLPKDASALIYLGNSVFKEVFEHLQETPYPPNMLGADPKRAVAWAVNLHIRKRDGKRVLALECEMEAGTAGYLLNVPLVGLVPSAIRQREQAYAQQCSDRAAALAKAMKQYADDNGGVFPEASKWVDQIRPYLKDATVLKCPFDTTERQTSFAMNRALSGQPLPSGIDLAHIVVIYESNNSSNSPSGDGSDVPATPHHVWRNAFGFADGHGALLSSAEAKLTSAGDAQKAPIWTW